MSYFIQLKDCNNRIQRLLKSINAYGSNVHHLETMTEAYSQQKAKLQTHLDSWDSEYVPAIDYRQSLRNDLYLAQNQEQEFVKKLTARILTLTESEIEWDICCMRNECEAYSTHSNSLKNALYAATSITTTNTTTSVSNSSGSTSIDESADTSFAAGTEVTEYGVGERKIGYIWTLASAIAILSQLEAENATVQTKMRGIASRSCALTVKLKTIEDEISILQAAISVPAKSLYSEVEAELLPLKIKHYTTVLSHRRSSAVKPRTLAPIRTSYSNVPSRLCFHSELSECEASSTPSWATTIASSVIESTIIGSEFGFNTEDIFQF